MKEHVVEKGPFSFKCLRNFVDIPPNTPLLTYKPADTKKDRSRLEGATLVGDVKRPRHTGKQAVDPKADA